MSECLTNIIVIDVTTCKEALLNISPDLALKYMLKRNEFIED
jgi:hypothetical protein